MTNATIATARGPTASASVRGRKTAAKFFYMTMTTGGARAGHSQNSIRGAAATITS